MTTYLGNSCSFGLPRVPFNCQFMYSVISLFLFWGRMWDLIVSVPDHCLSFYFRQLIATFLGQSCSFGLPCVPFVNCCQFIYLVTSILVLRAGCGIWLCLFLIIAYLVTFKIYFSQANGKKNFKVFSLQHPKRLSVIWQNLFILPQRYVSNNINGICI